MLSSDTSSLMSQNLSTVDRHITDLHYIENQYAKKLSIKLLKTSIKKDKLFLYFFINL